MQRGEGDEGYIYIYICVCVCVCGGGGVLQRCVPVTTTEGGQH